MHCHLSFLRNAADMLAATFPRRDDATRTLIADSCLRMHAFNQQA